MTTEIRSVAVVGTGLIGASWAACFLAQGLDVQACDPAPGAENLLRRMADQHWPALEILGLAPGASRERLVFEDKLESAVSGADFVQENGPEREDFKIALFQRMDSLLPPHVILASSSSDLATSRIQSGCAHPERVIVGHPFNPPHLIPLVEVIGGAATSPDTIERTMGFYEAIGKRPIHAKKEIAGHVVNRLQAALWREAFYLVEQGMASVEDINTAIVYGPGLRWAVMGPFLNLHLSGGPHGIGHLLDRGGLIFKWWESLGSPEMNEALQERVVDGVAAELCGRSAAELESHRDTLLLELLRTKQGLSSKG